MDKKFTLFLFLAFGVFALNLLVVNWFQGPQPVKKPPPAVADKSKVAVKPAAPQKRKAAASRAAPRQPKATAVSNIPVQWLTLGSADPAGAYRMLVLLTNMGAAVDQIELNAGFRDLDSHEPSGYLGPLAEIDAKPEGARVQAVGPGTPAAAAGLAADDVITALGGKPIKRAADLQKALERTKPGDVVKLTAIRAGRTLPAITATLGHHPLRIMSREKNHLGKFDQRSLLLTLAQLDDDELDDDQRELKGVKLWDARWQVRRHTPALAEFVLPLPDLGLEIVKRFRLASTSNENTKTGDPFYHLDLEVEIHNVGDQPRDVAYRLDGPTGLPIEGWWYASKISRDWSGVGTRDIAVMFKDKTPQLLSCTSVVDGEQKVAMAGALTYMGVDAQYFSAVLIPVEQDPADPWLAEAQPILAGPVPADKNLKKQTNVTCRLVSNSFALKPAAPPLAHTYRLFAGPKNPDVLDPYGLEPLVYYGWFGPVSTFLLKILHFFHAIVGNYGLAIIMLTVLVRGCMFPISRKQALGAQKMQELQPEMKKINEKYKTKPEERTRATQELFRKHKYNPLGGCLLMFLQLPIFIGLYRALMIDVELRQAPLIPGMRWCSNLAAPDMLFRWDGVLPGFLASETGWLGPYFNVLPLITVGLFLWQQKMFMPPPADEQAALQQKMMQYMMIFMAVMFFKVASGLCIYFIASSLWGIAERKLLPKISKPATGDVAAAPSTTRREARSGNNGGNGALDRKRRQERGKK